MSFPKDITKKLFKFINVSWHLQYAYNYLKINHIDTYNSERNIKQDSKNPSLQFLKNKWRLGFISKQEIGKKMNQFVTNYSQPATISSFQLSKKLQVYYGTHRPKNFKHDHWRKEMKSEIIEKIVSFPDCQKVLKLLNYL